MKFRFLIPLFIILLSLNLIIFDKDFYEKESPKFNEQEVSNLQNYFISKNLNSTNYSEEEVLHLKDVRNLILISLIINIILLVLIIIFSFQTKNLSKEFIYGGIYSIILIFILSLTLISFSDSFITFHKLLFTNNYWLLPENSTLIQMFPETFFNEALKQILFNSVIFSLGSVAIGYKLKPFQNN